MTITATEGGIHWKRYTPREVYTKGRTHWGKCTLRGINTEGINTEGGTHWGDYTQREIWRIQTEEMNGMSPPTLQAAITKSRDRSIRKVSLDRGSWCWSQPYAALLVCHDLRRHVACMTDQFRAPPNVHFEVDEPLLSTYHARWLGRAPRLWFPVLLTGRELGFWLLYRLLVRYLGGCQQIFRAWSFFRPKLKDVSSRSGFPGRQGREVLDTTWTKPVTWIPTLHNDEFLNSIQERDRSVNTTKCKSRKD